MANKINLDTSTRLDIICRKGDTFNLKITIKDTNDNKVDVTEDSFAMQVRTRATSDGVTGLILTTDPSQEAIDGGSTNPVLGFKDPITPSQYKAKFTVDRGSSDENDDTFGVVTFDATAFQMSNVPSGRYVYDLQRLDVNNNQQKTVITGSFVVKEDITEVGAFGGAQPA